MTGLYFKGKFLYVSTWVLILYLSIMTIDHDNNLLTASAVDIWEHRFQQEQDWSGQRVQAYYNFSNKKWTEIITNNSFESDWK